MDTCENTGRPRRRARRTANLIACSIPACVAAAPAFAATSALTLAAANGISMSGEVWTDPDVGPFGPGDADLGAGTTLLVGGNDSAGELTVAAQTSLSVGSLAISAGVASGTVTITDGSLVTLKGSNNRMGVANIGIGRLIISQGGVLDATLDPASCTAAACNIWVGGTAGSTGELTITDPGSRMDTVNGLFFSSAAVFTEANDGFNFGTPGGTSSAVVKVLNGAVLNSWSSHVSTGPGGGSPTGLETSIATVLIDGVGSQWNLSEWLQIGANRGFGTVIVSNGAVITAPQSTIVWTNGVLAGNGTIVGGVNNAGGIISPGQSPGTLTIDGGLQFDSGAFEAEVAGTGPGQFDVLRVTGAASFSGGTLRFYFIDGYLPRAGESVRVLEAGSVAGFENVAIEVEGLSPAFRYDVDADAGGVSIVAGSDAAPAQQELSIDVEPRDRQNRVPVKSQGTLQVAVRSTRPGEVDAYAFDACDLDLRTVRFGPRGARPTDHWKVDVDRDGDRDLVLAFNIRETGLRCTDTSAAFSAKTRAKTLVSGSDAVRAVGCGRN